MDPNEKLRARVVRLENELKAVKDTLRKGPGAPLRAPDDPGRSADATRVPPPAGPAAEATTQPTAEEAASLAKDARGLATHKDKIDFFRQQHQELWTINYERRRIALDDHRIAIGTRLADAKSLYAAFLQKDRRHEAMRAKTCV